MKWARSVGVLLLLGCTPVGGDDQTPEGGEAFSLQIPAQGETPAYEVTLRLDPPRPPDEVAASSSQLFVDAFRGCETEAKRTPWDPIVMRFQVSAGRVESVRPDEATALTRCLTRALSRREFSGYATTTVQVVARIERMSNE